MRVVDFIDEKRLGKAHSREQILTVIRGYTSGEIPDYQISAWLMAVVLRGLNEDETFALTDAMLASGATLDIPGAGVRIDKHSTGGVGDKTTLAVVPILASLGVRIAKMSGRGLGHTGGTLDKLEAIPGLRTNLTLEEIQAQVAATGACICAQSETLVPADRKLYALRDATATVQSLPLIAASIMSKKLASGASAIVLDVKAGTGAFMKSIDDAEALAELMIQIGTRYGRHTTAVISDMNAPLGYNVGNLLEMREVVALLKDNPWSEPRLRELVLYLSAVGLQLAGVASTTAEGQDLAQRALADGRALAALVTLVAAQGGDAGMLTQTVKQPSAKAKKDVKAPVTGYVQGITADAVGVAAMELGAGREKVDDVVDPLAGVVLRKHVGSFVTEGTVIATLHSSCEVLLRRAEERVVDAFAFGPEPRHPVSIVSRTINSHV